ncbi:hypothetical protein ACKKBG_A15910 [Auxenochlorella protothecoides x Auxenochlorella symbiontica]
MVDLGLDQPDAQRFLWAGNGEPHAMRRRLILAKYGPEVRKLYGYDHATAWQVIGVMLLQVYMAWLVKDWSWGAVLVASYFISGTANQNLFSAQHEISHFLAFRRPLYNKILALASNMVLVVPVAVKFREYHHDHHLFLGIDGGDVDLPTVLEVGAVGSLAAKLAWGLVYLCIYGLRPLIVRPKPPSAADAVNWATTLGFDLALLYFWGLKPVAYLLIGSLIGGSLLHPMGGHLLAEHYMFEKGQETYSYYGPMNALTYNVGYHNEHHDFPQIPHTRLHKLRRIAPEFYEPMYQHHSWCWVLWAFFADEKVGPWLRVHRLRKEGAAPTNTRFSEYGGLYAVWRRLACSDPEPFAPGVAGEAGPGAPAGTPVAEKLTPAPVLKERPTAAQPVLGGLAQKPVLTRRSAAMAHGRNGSSEENTPPPTSR